MFTKLGWASLQAPITDAAARPLRVSGATGALATAGTATTLHLAAGQSCGLRLPAGSHLQVEAGAVFLQAPPSWLAERVWLVSPQRLGRGQGLGSVDAVCWQVQSLADSTLRIHRPAASRWQQVVRIALQRAWRAVARR